ncbi:ATP-dependent RecD-like DNA helicase [uncultured Ruminococcus sp.]|uniref:SF1B family DNA helicase RecD2 n=1 Tax=uncultured Ruminococcus sp. TaxID=165186 RepID=UPI0025F9B653|nr:ATP-dependent RecD-like DNA helicase [uncultured Ruminococcus sp.]
MSELIQVEGEVDFVQYKNDDGSFCVIDVKTEDELIKAVGALGNVEEGEMVILTGEYVNNEVYGRQLRVAMFERSLPTTEASILRYLSSGALESVRPLMAKRLVKEFGEKTLEIIENEPNRLLEIKGLDKEKVKAIHADFKKTFAARALMVYMSKNRIPTKYSVRAWKMLGDPAEVLIRKNPYLMCGDGIELPFGKADDIAQSENIPRDSEQRIRAGIKFVLRQVAKELGHTCIAVEALKRDATRLLGISGELFDKVKKVSLEEREIYELDIDGVTFAMLDRYYKAEEYISRRLEVMRSITHDNRIDYSTVIDLEESETGIHYEEKQREAINKALSEGFLVLTGGPGTGKTTTLNAIISLFEQQGLDVLIAAPTGRAAKRISDLTGRTAKTIHRLLEVIPSCGDDMMFVHDEEDLLECDVMVVDEMSMVDSELFEALLRALSVTCKLVLVGDSDQLPPVGAGNVLRDIIDSGVMTVVRLTEVFRQAMESDIVMNAHRIVSGEMIDLKKRDKDFVYLCRPKAEQICETLVELCSERLPKKYGCKPIADIQVLSPTRKGVIGTPELNKLLQNGLNPPKKNRKELKTLYCTYREGDKVMQTRNDYTISWKRIDGSEEESGKGIYNGDIGLVRKVDTSTKTVTVDFDGRMAQYNGEMLDNLELAYAITVHKSQGSEYDVVILTLYNGVDNLYYRNLLYTAVTRAKKLLVLLGTSQRVAYMIMNNGKNHRYTALRKMLVDGAYNDELRLAEEE